MTIAGNSSTRCRTGGHLEGILDHIEFWGLAFDQEHLDDVETELELWSSEEAQPLQSTTLDESLFVGADGVGGSAEGSTRPCLDLNESQCGFVSADEIDLASVGCTKVSVQHFSTTSRQPLRCEVLTQKADLGAGAGDAVRCRDVGSAERPARTSGDESGKGHKAAAPPDAGACRSLCVARIHIPDASPPDRASVGRE